MPNANMPPGFGRDFEDDIDDLVQTQAHTPSYTSIPTLSTSPLNIWDGNVHYNISRHLSPSADFELGVINKEIAPPQTPVDPNANKHFVAQMLESETSLNLSKFTIVPRFSRTRHTIDQILESVVGSSGKVALPIPNWSFWTTDGHTKGKFAYEYLPVSSGEELVESFARNADKVKALLLVNPANPLGYSLTFEQCRTVDDIAQKNGVQIVIDEVLRGNQPIGKRESFGTHFSEPIVIEGFSHRFGLDMKNFTYALLPKSKSQIIAPTPNQVPTTLLQEVYMKCNGAVNEAMIARNKALTDGFIDLNIEVDRVAQTQVTGMLYLPPNVDLKKITPLAKAENLTAGTIYNMLPPNHEPPQRYAHAMRISAGTMTAQQCYEAATRLSRVIKKASQ